MTLVKLGGSLLTDKKRPESVRQGDLDRLAREVALGLDQSTTSVLLAHGSGSFGHVAAAGSGLDRIGGPGVAGSARAQDREFRRAVSRTQDAAARLHRRVVAALLEAGVDAFSLAPSSFAATEAGELVLSTEPMALACDHGWLPVTYGDVVLDRAGGAAIASTEEVLIHAARALLANGRKIARCLWLGTTAGILDPAGGTVAQVDDSNRDRVRDWVGGSAGVDVTGGMRLRLEAACRLAALGIESQILDGTVEGLLASALAGEIDLPGTRVPATAV